MIVVTTKRTRLLLKIRRLITAQQRANRPDWPAEAIEELVTRDMKSIAQWPTTKVRLLAASL